MFLPGHLVARYVCLLAPLNLFTCTALLCLLCSLAPFTGCSLPSLPRGLVKFINMCSRCKRWNKCSFHLHQKHALILSKSHWTKKLWNYGFRTRFDWRRPGIVLDTYIHCIIRHRHSGPNVSLPSIQNRSHSWKEKKITNFIVCNPNWLWCIPLLSQDFFQWHIILTF